MPTVGVGSIAADGTFVVEADVAAGDGRAERAAGLGHAFDRFAELEEILRLVRVAEIEVVGDGERHGAGAGEVARSFGDGDAGAFARILPAVDARCSPWRRRGFCRPRGR